MKTLVAYDSMYGNTEQLARAIGAAIGAVVGGDVSILRASEVSAGDLQGLDLLFVGAPTQGGQATQPIQDLLGRLTAAGLKSTRAAAFDTRLSWFFLKLFGFAADKIAAGLQAGGLAPAAPPEGFYVKGRQGPLKDGELERAATWAKQVAAKAK